MRLFVSTSVLVTGCCLAGSAGQLQDTQGHPAKVIQSVLSTVASPALAPQQDWAAGTASHAISAPITKDPGQVLHRNTVGHGKTTA
jgi:hypothetical protein